MSSSFFVDGKEEIKEEMILSETIICSKPLIIQNKDFVEINLNEATTTTWEIGKPMIPVIKRIYTFPFGTVINDVTVSYFDKDQINIQKPVKIAPEFLQTSLSNVHDGNIYIESSINYKARAGLKNDQHVIYLCVPIYPIQYLKNDNLLIYSKEAKVDISYNLPQNQFFQSNIYDLLIITPDKFLTTLQPLVEFYSQLEKPISVKVVTLDDIYSGTYFDVNGIDNQEKIKYFIKDSLENWGIKNILLIGGGLKDYEELPVRYSWIKSEPYEDKFASDLYYADIYNAEGGFSSWDYDGDGMYAEFNSNKNDMPAVDLLPDVYLGRLPVNNNIELETIVDKIINYKKYNKMNYEILQAGSDTFPVQYGDESGIFEGEYTNIKVMEKLNGYDTTNLWGTNHKISKFNIAKKLRNGVDFVDFSGHGWYVRWCTYAPNDPTTWLPKLTLLSPSFGWMNADFNLYNCKSDKYFVAFYNGCCTSKFTQILNCLSWRTLSYPDGGGIASFGASGIAYCGVGSEASEKVLGWLEIKCFEELYNTKVLGQVWSNCITEYVNTFGPDLDKIDCKTIFEFTMFGDPTLIIEDGPEDPPIIIDETQMNNELYEPEEIIINIYQENTQESELFNENQNLQNLN